MNDNDGGDELDMINARLDRFPDLSKMTSIPKVAWFVSFF